MEEEKKPIIDPEKVEEFKEKAAEAFDDVKEKAGEVFDDVKEKAGEVFDDVKEKIEDAKAAAAADDNDVYTAEDIDKNKVFAILAYLGILFIVPILAAKDSKFARFHTNQGVILFICGILGSIMSCIPIIKYFAWIVSLGVFVLAVMGIIAAAKGEAKELPIIGKYRIIK